jgi:glutamine synthetase
MFDIETGDEVKDIVEKRDIKYLQFWFTDVLGFLKGFTITPSELDGAFEDGMGFDGSSIKGFTRIDESDMTAHPDPSTFKILPDVLSEDRTALMFCDIKEPDGTPYKGDPRYVLKRAISEAQDRGFTDYYVGPELEFFYFKNEREPIGLDYGGYFDFIPRDEAQHLRRQTINCLEELGIDVEYAHHEVAPSQHEIDLRFKNGLDMADTVMTYRYVVKEIASINDVYATFMPKPIEGENGSGMHTHMSLFEDGKNAFFEKEGKYHLSEEGRQYIAGILEHADELTAVTNQWVNSYKRLCPGYEAPVYVTWARRNRSDMVRVPQYAPGKEQATRMEFRSPDPACNPYFAFATMLRAGLAGIDNGYELEPPVEDNAYEMTEEELAERDIGILPESLNEALKSFEDSELMTEALGEHSKTQFLKNKEEEWEKFRTHVSQFELEEFLPIL